MVPTSSLIMMAVDAAFGIAVPLALAWYMVRRHKARISTILTGAGAFFLFALVLESIMHQIVLKGPHGAALMGNKLWYAIYGGLAAGIFEETGRFLSMKFLMKKEPSAPIPGVSYGVGHGGMEMLIVFGVAMIGNLVMSAMINAGLSDALFSQAPQEAAAQVQAQIDALQGLTTGALLIGLWERLSALLLHLGLSVLVWASVHKGGRWLWLFPAAIALHAVVDTGAVLLKDAVGMVQLELIVTSEAIAIAAAAFMVAKKFSPLPKE